jgi:hypothetical protein
VHTLAFSNTLWLSSVYKMTNTGFVVETQKKTERRDQEASGQKQKEVGKDIVPWQSALLKQPEPGATLLLVT